MSKLTKYDFRCIRCDTVTEQLVKPGIYYMPCPECFSQAKRLISAPRIQLSGTDPDFPGAYAKWEKVNKQKTAQDKKFYADHGVDKKHHSYGS